MQRMRSICLDAVTEHNHPDNDMLGANIAGFVKVDNTMLDQGVV